MHRRRMSGLVLLVLGLACAWGVTAPGQSALGQKPEPQAHKKEYELRIIRVGNMFRRRLWDNQNSYSSIQRLPLKSHPRRKAIASIKSGAMQLMKRTTHRIDVPHRARMNHRNIVSARGKLICVLINDFQSANRPHGIEWQDEINSHGRELSSV